MAIGCAGQEGGALQGRELGNAAGLQRSKFIRKQIRGVWGRGRELWLRPLAACSAAAEKPAQNRPRPSRRREGELGGDPAPKGRAPGRALRASGGLGPGSQPLSTHRLTGGGAGREGGGRARDPDRRVRPGASLQAGDAAGGLFGPAPVGSPSLTAAGWGGGLRRPPVSTCCWKRSTPATG